MSQLFLRLSAGLMISSGLVLASTFTGNAQIATHAMKACETLHTGEDAAVERRRRVIMTYVVFLERQGRAAPEPEYTVEQDSCLADVIEVDGKQVLITSAGFNKGLQTLYYRIVFKDGEDLRSVLVLYSGMVSAVFEGDYFFVSETRGLSTSFYEVYKAQPSHETLRELATDIVRGEAKPLVIAEFREAEWEMYMTDYDLDRIIEEPDFPAPSISHESLLPSR